MHDAVILVCLNKNRTGFPRRASLSGETQKAGSRGRCCAVGEASREIGFYLTDISGCFSSFLNERKACNNIKLSCSHFPCVNVRITQKCTECIKWNNYSVDGVYVHVCVCARVCCNFGIKLAG